MAVSFHSEQLDFTLSNPDDISLWLANVCQSEGKVLSDLTYIFCSDDYLLKINQEFLNHNYFTDVITFDYSESDTASGDVFISVERVAENSSELRLTFIEELHRVMVHGLLHLLGYKDKEELDEQEMRDKEDFYLSLRSF